MMGFLIRIFKFALKSAIVIGGIAVVISYARLSEYGDMRKELLDKVLQSYAGRIHIDGKVELQATFPPSVTIENVRIKNAKWATRPDMMTEQKIVAEIDLLPLLTGNMAVPRLRMIGVDIIVERKANGNTNWDELNNFETAAGPANPAALPGIFPQIGGATVAVSGGTLTIVNAAASVPTVLSLGGTNLIVSGLSPCL